jgi:14-3-3 protein
VVKYSEVINYYKNRVEKELESYCNEILTLIDNVLLKKTVNTESRVFYHKMKGDYNRYMAEFTSAKTYKIPLMD